MLVLFGSLVSVVDVFGGLPDVVKVFRSLEGLSFHKLMRVYEESNRLNAVALYPHMDRNAALIQVEQDFYVYLRDCFFRTEGAWYAVWSENDSYISALRLEPFEDGLLLEALETDPDYRRCGYGYKLMDAVLHSVVENVYSHVNKSNTDSFRLHEKCGFVKIADECTYIDGTRSDRCVTLKWAKE